MKLLTLTAVGILFASQAMAAEWVIDAQKSHLGFTGTQGTASFNGSFKKFDAKVILDPDHPENGTINTTIDIVGITAGSEERDSQLPQKDWFDSTHFPQAQFASKQIRKVGDHAYEAQGDLTIKNITKPVILSFTLMQEGDAWHAKGQAPLTRTDFTIGAGSWSGEDYVKHAVTVTFDIWAKPKGKTPI